MITLSLPPSLNHAYVNYGGGRRGLSTLAKRWRRDAKMQVKMQFAEPVEEAVQLFVTFYWANNRRRDADNALKLIMDALSGTLLWDDCWQAVRLLHVYNTLDREDPRVEVMFKIFEDRPVAEKHPRTAHPSAGRGGPLKGKKDGDAHTDDERAA